MKTGPSADRSLPPLVVTMGEPAGIGSEITLMAWSRRTEGLPSFFLLDDPARVAALAQQLGIDATVREIGEPEAAVAAIDRGELPVIAIPLAAPVVPGHADGRNARAVLQAIDRAVALVKAGQASGMVTNPIHKKTLYEAGFRHPGHTEYLAELAGDGSIPVMLLACPGLRVIPVTIHLPLGEAVKALTREAIVTTGRIAASDLRRSFGKHDPVLAVAALNPHAGEGGTLGREEIEIIAPAVEALRAEGIKVVGPAPADTLFHARARTGYDAVLCMYHDQALIPLKTIDFDRGVNVTLGLPFVRTSPDHGTAFDIAGTGRASPESLMAALRVASEMAAIRAAG
jgi:4-hydroxythreonine-4-phosphate dehydrogenase